MASLIVEPLLIQDLKSKTDKDLLTKPNDYDEDNDCIFISTNVVKSGLCFYLPRKKIKKNAETKDFLHIF